MKGKVSLDNNNLKNNVAIGVAAGALSGAGIGAVQAAKECKTVAKVLGAQSAKELLKDSFTPTVQTGTKELFKFAKENNCSVKDVASQTLSILIKKSGDLPKLLQSKVSKEKIIGLQKELNNTNGQMACIQATVLAPIQNLLKNQEIDSKTIFDATKKYMKNTKSKYILTAAAAFAAIGAAIGCAKTYISKKTKAQ